MLALIFSALFLNSSHAGDFGYGSTTYEKVRAGDMMFPSAFCPDVNRRFEELNEKLSTLKASIKKDAKCSDEQIKVDNFSEVVEKGRGEFWNLVNKGRQQSLSEAEANQITGYIENLTKAGAAITDLILGSSCFKDDKKNFVSIELVASLISEATAALGTVRGPYGPMITMAGKITANLIVSIDKIVRSRQAYDFTNADQRKVLVKTMCSYNGFRREIDEISRVDSATRDMTNYQDALHRQIKGIINACPECKSIVEQYNKDYLAGADYVRKPISELQIMLAAQIKPADDRFLSPLGSQVVVASRSFVWAQDELNRLNRNISDIGDVERDRVIKMQDVIEDFFFVKWLPKLVEYYQGELSVRLDALDKVLHVNLSWLGVNTWFRGYTTLDMAPILFSDRGAELGSFNTARERNLYQRSAQAEFNRMLGETVSALLIVEKNCEFVRASQMKYEMGMHKVCDRNHSATADRAYSVLWKLLQTSHKKSPLVMAAFEVPGPTLLTWAEVNNVTLPRTGYVWTSNWLQSLVLLMDKLHALDAAAYRLK